jgi:hypothetical protein
VGSPGGDEPAAGAGQDDEEDQVPGEDRVLRVDLGAEGLGDAEDDAAGTPTSAAVSGSWAVARISRPNPVRCSRNWSAPRTATATARISAPR